VPLLLRGGALVGAPAAGTKGKIYTSKKERRSGQHRKKKPFAFVLWVTAFLGGFTTLGTGMYM